MIARRLAFVALALPLAAAGTEPRDVHEILRARWADWIGTADRVQAADLDEEAARVEIRGDEAAACAALIQTLHYLSRKKQVDHVDREPLLAGGDPMIDRVLTGSYKACLRKQGKLPTDLWVEGAPRFEAVSQSGDRTGDCWLLAPTGWMVKHRPQVVRGAIEPIGDGRWRVTFPSKVVVEVSAPTETEMLATNALPTLEDGLWLPVIKEAMGTVLGERNAKKAAIESESLRLNGGSMPRMMEHWTGHVSRTVRLEGKAPIDEVRSAITEALERRALIGLGTGKEPAGKIPPNHAYAVFGFDAATDTLSVWNPWNNDFTPEGESNRENGYARKDGLSQIPLADAVQIFRTLFIETDQPFDATKPSAKEAAARARKAADAKAGAKP